MKKAQVPECCGPRLLQRLCVLLVLAVLALPWPLAAATTPPPEGYVLGVGDRISVTIFGHPDLSGEFVVGAGGEVAMPLIGAVPARNSTVTELIDRVETALKDGFVKEPRVTISLIEARPFYILGDVREPGSYPYVQGMNVINAVALAGGLLTADKDRVGTIVEATKARELAKLRRREYFSALLREARLISTLDDLEELKLPPFIEERREHPDIAKLIESEQRVFEADQDAYKQQLAILESQIPQIEEEMRALTAEREAKLDERGFIRQELAAMSSLQKKGYARTTQVLQLRRQAAELTGEAANIDGGIARAKQKIGGVRSEILSLSKERLKAVLTELKAVQETVAAGRTSLEAAEEMLRQRERATNILTASEGEDDGELVVSITRLTPDGLQTFEAENTTPVFPGDVVRLEIVSRYSMVAQ